MKFLRYLWLACGGFRTYRELFDLSLRSVLIYWALFTALLSLVLVGNMVYRFKMGFPAIQNAARSIPSFRLTNGQASSSLSQPYYANTNQFPIVFDLEEKVSAPEKMFPSGILIRKREFRFWIEKSQPIAVSWTGWPDGEFNADYLKKLEEQILLNIPWFYLLIWIGVALLGMIQALLFTTLAGMLERALRPGFTFAQLFNIALFAITPGAIIVATYLSFGLGDIPYALLYFSCYCFFLVMASGACRVFLQPSEKNKGEEE